MVPLRELPLQVVLAAQIVEVHKGDQKILPYIMMYDLMQFCLLVEIMEE